MHGRASHGPLCTFVRHCFVLSSLSALQDKVQSLCQVWPSDPQTDSFGLGVMQLQEYVDRITIAIIMTLIIIKCFISFFET